MECTFIGWRALEPEAQAAWAQALLSVLAISVAIFVPTYLHLKEMKQRDMDRQARKKSMALAVLNELIPVESELESYIDQWSGDFRDHLDSEEFAKLTTAPPKLMALAQDLHELSEVSQNVSEVLLALALARKQHKTWDYQRYGAGTDLSLLEDAILSNLQHAREAARQANTELLRLFSVSTETGGGK